MRYEKAITFYNYTLSLVYTHAQTCGTGGYAAIATNSTGQYPTGIFSTISFSLSTVSTYMNGGNYILFNVTSGDVYE